MNMKLRIQAQDHGAGNGPAGPRFRDRSSRLPPFASRAHAFGAQARRPGFTLIEIVVCMAIFAVGFAAIAMMLPAGAVMQRDIEARGIGDIVGKNSLEVMKAKGVQALVYDYKGTDYMPMGIEQCPWQGLASPGAANDLDWALFQWNWEMNSNWALTCPICQQQMQPYFDTNGNGSFMQWLGTGGYRYDLGSDCTNMLLGRIHVYKERPIPGFTLGRTSPLDFSFPSNVLDITQRTYFSSILQTNQSADCMPGGQQPYTCSSPSSHAWQLTAITLKSDGAGEWPEQVEFDPTQPALSVRFASDMATSPAWLCSNTPVDFRSIGGDSSLAGLPDPGPNYLWPTYSSGSAASQGTVPATGGAPGDPKCSGRVQGWCNMLDYGYQVFGSSYNTPGWNCAARIPALVATPVNTPIREKAASQYGYYPAGSTAPYRYPVPNVISLVAIVYDRDNSLFLLRYPQNFAQNPVGGNTRVDDYRTACGLTTNWIDRKLKVGDQFLAARGAYPFKVKEVLDPTMAALSAPGTSVAGKWSDGTYQIVRVSPSLRTTFYTANKPVGEFDPSVWNDPCPGRVLVSPPPVSGGPSPWVSTQQLTDGGTSTQNGAVFRSWDNLTD